MREEFTARYWVESYEPLEKVAQVIAGHKHARTTENYASPSAEAARKAIEMVG